MLRKAVPAGLAVALVVALGSAAPLKSEPAKPAADPDLAGRLVIVTMKGEKQHSTVLEHVRVRRLGNREFLVGDHVPMDDEAAFEAAYWLPLDDVEFLMDFKDKAAVKKMYELRDKAEKGAKDRQ